VNMLPTFTSPLSNLRHLQIHHISSRDHYLCVRDFVYKALNLESISPQFVNPVENEDMAEVAEPDYLDWTFISSLNYLKVFRLLWHQFKGKRNFETLM
jgi:hypothetical protein